MPSVRASASFASTFAVWHAFHVRSAPAIEIACVNADRLLDAGEVAELLAVPVSFANGAR